MSKGLTNNDVDTHDPAGMARWLRERSNAAHDFLALDSEAQQRQYLNKWQQNVLPHLAFRFKQAAEMVENQARMLDVLERENAALKETQQQAVLELQALRAESEPSVEQLVVDVSNVEPGYTAHLRFESAVTSSKCSSLKPSAEPTAEDRAKWLADNNASLDKASGR